MILEKFTRVEVLFHCFTFVDMIRFDINLYFLSSNEYQVVVII